MSEEKEDQLDRIEVLLHVQRCELAALVYEVVDLSAKVRVLMKTAVTEPKVPISMVEVPDSYLRFMKNWKENLQKHLENIEDIDPGRAARFQAIINGPGDQGFFDYEE